MLTHKEKVEVKKLLSDLSRKLLLLESVKSSLKRSEVIDFIVLDKDGELKQLSRLLKIRIFN